MKRRLPLTFVVIVAGLAGGFLADAALANPNRVEALLIGLGALWAAMMLAGLLRWLTGRRKKARGG